jgi:predicted glycoside hydrolase/deacetylase ChbG (UPF0249 family)
MVKQLIVNADGFGFSLGVNKGIIETIENGIVTSISALANMPYIEEIPALSKYSNVSIGIHFNLLVGRPLSQPGEVPSLIDGKGEFLRGAFAKRLLTGKIRKSEIVLELNNQAEKLNKLGINPISHFSGYQTKHLYPLFFGAAIEIAQKWGIKRMRCYRRFFLSKEQVNLPIYYLTHPKRIVTHNYSRYLTWYANNKGIKTADRLITLGFKNVMEESSLETWLSMIKSLPEGINEIRVHPGYPDEELAKYSSYVKERKTEVDVLTSSKVKDALLENGVELISFNEL